MGLENRVQKLEQSGQRPRRIFVTYNHVHFGERDRVYSIRDLDAFKRQGIEVVIFHVLFDRSRGRSNDII